MVHRAVFVVSSNFVPGGEDDYNAWYTGTHLDETLRVPGVVSAQRFRLSDAQMAGQDGRCLYRYLAIYECEGDIEAIIAEFNRRQETGELTYSIAYDRGGHPSTRHDGGVTPRPTGFFYDEITPKRQQ